MLRAIWCRVASHITACAANFPRWLYSKYIQYICIVNSRVSLCTRARVSIPRTTLASLYYICVVRAPLNSRRRSSRDSTRVRETARNSRSTLTRLPWKRGVAAHTHTHPSVLARWLDECSRTYKPFGFERHTKSSRLFCQAPRTAQTALCYRAHSALYIYIYIYSYKYVALV